MSAFGTAPVSLDSPIVSHCIDSSHRLVDLLRRQTLVVLLTMAAGNAVSTARAQQPAGIGSLRNELDALQYEPFEFEQIDYEQLALPLPIERLAMPPQGAQSGAIEPVQVGRPAAASLHMPRQMAAAACDQPGYFAPPPCPPQAQAPPPVEAPPKRQVHHVHVQPPAAPPPAQQPAFSPPAAATGCVCGAASGRDGGAGTTFAMRITFPALTLELPSIELPHWIRRGRAAHMELAGGTAPYVAATGVAQHGVSRVSLANPHAAPARPAAAAPQPQQTLPSPPAADPVTLQEDFEKLQQRCQRLEELLEKMIQCQQPPAGLQMPPAVCPPTPHHHLRPQPECLPVPSR